MTDATPSQPPGTRSSVLYALGKLEATVAAQADTIGQLPSRILEVIAPQLLQIGDHETRIRSLERQRWVLFGGGSLLILVVGWAVDLHK